MFKRFALSVTTVWIILASHTVALAEPPTLHGRAAVLMDGLTGQILFEQNGAKANFPASTTKLLTALVAVEHGDINQPIKVSPEAVKQTPDSSSCYLNAGEEQRLEYLLYGLLLSSGNDCAIAIAEGVTRGNPQQFIAWMNETAKRLGATHSNFTNPHGLHDPDHFTTAIDLAIIARAALANSIISKISGTREFAWPGKSNGIYYNHNALLFTYDGTIGGKTGYTEEARLTLVSAANRQGLILIGVTMGEETKAAQYRDMTALLDYGFEHFERKIVVPNGSPLGNVPVAGGTKKSVAAIAQQDILMTVLKGTEPNISITRKIDSDLKAPIHVGQQVGTVEVRQSDQMVMMGPIIAQESVPLKPSFAQLLGKWSKVFLQWIASILGGLFVIRIIVRSTRRILSLRRRQSYKNRRSISGRKYKNIPSASRSERR